MDSIPKLNAFEILDQFIKTMVKTKLNNRNYYTIQTKAMNKARSGLREWGYNGPQCDELLDDARDMANIIRRSKA